jgi:hypothetical protein
VNEKIFEASSKQRRAYLFVAIQRIAEITVSDHWISFTVKKEQNIVIPLEEQ